MADSREKAATQLREITECPICLNAFTDPRMLPCIHTFCLECLKRTSEASQMKPGDKMPCPLCQRDFTIPSEGVTGLQRNFFMENFLEFKSTLHMESGSLGCYSCNIRNDGKRGSFSVATKRCLECRDDYCDGCSKVHQLQKVSKNHHIAKIGSESEKIIRMTNVRFCSKHIHKPLDYYCAECKKIVCVSCFVESHKLHDGKDVTTVDEEFRETIEEKAWKISAYANEMLLMRNNNNKRKTDFLKGIVEKEKEIHKRIQELKAMIDRHTKSLLDELSVIKSKHLKDMETGLEETDTYYTTLRSLEAYCTELISKGSASDICSSVDQLLARADDLEKKNDAFIGRPHQSPEVSFQATDLGVVLQNANNNFVGNVEENKTQFENFAVVVGIDNGVTLKSAFVKLNLDQPNDISTQQHIPTTVGYEAVAAVYCNTMYVAGLGDYLDEIWKYNFVSGWMKCASFVERRRKHCAAFINEVLYICGGYLGSKTSALDSVEAYSAVTDKCTIVGTLVSSVYSSGNCVPLKSLLYIFGGSDEVSNAVDFVQVYNTEQNTCTLLPKPMPRRYNMMRAAVWETYSVILLGKNSCFIYNFETETWQEREQFKSNVLYFGSVLDNERLFVIGGSGTGCETEKDDEGRPIWKYRDEVRYVPVQNILQDKPIEWKIHGKLPQPCNVRACVKMRFPV